MPHIKDYLFNEDNNLVNGDAVSRNSTHVLVMSVCRIWISVHTLNLREVRMRRSILLKLIQLRCMVVSVELIWIGDI